MRKKTGLFLITLLFFSCKAKHIVAASEMTNKTAVQENKELIADYYKKNIDFQTAYFRTEVNYTSEKDNISLAADVKIKKGEKILISLKFAFVTVAKILITPQKVFFYEKMKGTYFEGDFEYLSNWLGTPLEYQKVENILLGYPIENLNKEKLYYLLQNYDHVFSSEDGQYKKEYFFQENPLALQKQYWENVKDTTKFSARYTPMLIDGIGVLPKNISIQVQQKEVLKIDIEYKNSTFNEKITFPYEVPSGYKLVEFN